MAAKKNIPKKVTVELLEDNCITDVQELLNWTDTYCEGSRLLSYARDTYITPITYMYMHM